MSNRIKELAEQARKKPLGNSWTYRHSGEFEQKFAELIVRECADLADTLSEAYDAPSTTGKFIKAHFGFE